MTGSLVAASSKALAPLFDLNLHARICGDFVASD